MKRFLLASWLVLVPAAAFAQATVQMSGDCTLSNTGAVACSTLSGSTSTVGTPTIAIAGSPATATYTTRVLRSVALGPVIEFTIDVEWSAISGSGAVTITGLPTTAAVLSPEISIAGFGVTPPASPYATVTGAGVINLLLSGSGNASTSTPLQASALSSAGGILISGRYWVN